MVDHRCILLCLLGEDQVYIGLSSLLEYELLVAKGFVANRFGARCYDYSK